jgi:putative FmdB family regulatory protein
LNIIFKCTECGNTFKKYTPTQDDVVTCPVCDAQYKVVATSDGKLTLRDFVLDENDFGEL